MCRSLRRAARALHCIRWRRLRSRRRTRRFRLPCGPGCRRLRLGLQRRRAVATLDMISPLSAVQALSYLCFQQGGYRNFPQDGQKSRVVRGPQVTADVEGAPGLEALALFDLLDGQFDEVVARGPLLANVDALDRANDDVGGLAARLHGSFSECLGDRAEGS